jgi:hypothetical protein
MIRIELEIFDIIYFFIYTADTFTLKILNPEDCLRLDGDPDIAEFFKFDISQRECD